MCLLWSNTDHTLHAISIISVVCKHQHMMNSLVLKLIIMILLMSHLRVDNLDKKSLSKES